MLSFRFKGIRLLVGSEPGPFSGGRAGLARAAPHARRAARPRGVLVVFYKAIRLNCSCKRDNYFRGAAEAAGRAERVRRRLRGSCRGVPGRAWPRSSSAALAPGPSLPAAHCRDAAGRGRHGVKMAARDIMSESRPKARAKAPGQCPRRAHAASDAHCMHRPAPPAALRLEARPRRRQGASPRPGSVCESITVSGGEESNKTAATPVLPLQRACAGVAATRAAGP